MIVVDDHIDDGGSRVRHFEVERDGHTVPGVLWTPAGAESPRPKVLFGHGGFQDKEAPNIVRLATALVRDHRYACVSIDAPGHGDRVTAEERARARARLRTFDTTQPRYRGETTDPYMPQFLGGVRDWTAVLDEVERLPDVGPGPTGWWGVSMGTSIGLPFVATEPRIGCAVLGLASTVPRPGNDDYLGWAKSLTMPLLFLCQRDDTGHPIGNALELFDLFGSADKTMHLNPGPHVGVPAFEQDESARFLRRHLGEIGNETTLNETKLYEHAVPGGTAMREDN